MLLFGGQSSRDPAMFDRLEAAWPEVGHRARRTAAAVLGGDPTDFSSNRAIQVSVLAASLGWLELLTARGLRSDASAGLSLGEYAHLVDIGALRADDALALVEKRGALYDDGPDGAMAAVFPADWEELAPLVERVSATHGDGGLAAAVFNSPTQTVVGGSAEAVADLLAAAEEELWAQGVVVESRIPMHTPRFRPVAGPLARALEAAPWTGRARVPYLPNVTAVPSSADASTVVDRLTRHVHEPVRWRDTVDGLVARYPDAVFLEVGPRTVLADLMRRRWHADREILALDDPRAPLDEVRMRVDDVLARATELPAPEPSA